MSSKARVIEFNLPWPPSVNSIWRTPRSGALAGRTLLSSEVRKYRKAVNDEILVQRIPRHTLAGKLQVWIWARPPDQRARDLDNLPKAILDALVKAGVIADDQHIDELHIVRERNLPPNGKIHLIIAEILQIPSAFVLVNRHGEKNAMQKTAEIQA